MSLLVGRMVVMEGFDVRRRLFFQLAQLLNYHFIILVVLLTSVFHMISRFVCMASMD